MPKDMKFPLTEERTTITWRFEDEYAPDRLYFLPCPALDANLARVEVTFFRCWATMQAVFIHNTLGSRVLEQNTLSFFEGEEGKKICAKADIQLRSKEEPGVPVFADGDVLTVYFGFSWKSGEGIVSTSYNVFINFCEALGDHAYLGDRRLPTPKVGRETMVAMYDGWSPYGKVTFDDHATRILEKYHRP